jgi:hypothetical protein
VKRIVICADGTWNVRDQVDEETKKRRPSNVTKIARAVLPQSADGIDQVVYYDEGLGTGNAVDKFSGGAFGRGIEENIRQLYRFIVYNYQSGDELYFFGFSRGAFTVRSLAGFMNLVGLVQKDDDFYVPDIYGCRRPLGQQVADGEAIHQSAIDRAAHADSRYEPENLKAARAGAIAIPVVTTTRCPRGTPCSPPIYTD